MQLRYEHMRIVARVADNRDALCVSLQVCSVQPKEELCWIAALVEEWMAGRSVAVEAFKIELRAARIVQPRDIGVALQNGPVSRNVVSHKLAEDGPTGRGVTQGIGGVLDISAIADTACAAESMQESLIGLKRWQLGKHPSVTYGAKRGIDCHFGSRRRQAMISNGGDGVIHEIIHSNVASTSSLEFSQRLGLVTTGCAGRRRCSVLPGR